MASSKTVFLSLSLSKSLLILMVSPSRDCGITFQAFWDLCLFFTDTLSWNMLLSFSNTSLSCLMSCTLGLCIGYCPCLILYMFNSLAGYVLDELSTFRLLRKFLFYISISVFEFLLLLYIDFYNHMLSESIPVIH